MCWFINLLLYCYMWTESNRWRVITTLSDICIGQVPHRWPTPCHLGAGGLISSARKWPSSLKDEEGPRLAPLRPASGLQRMLLFPTPQAVQPCSLPSDHFARPPLMRPWGGNCLECKRKHCWLMLKCKHCWLVLPLLSTQSALVCMRLAWPMHLTFCCCLPSS